LDKIRAEAKKSGSDLTEILSEFGLVQKTSQISPKKFKRALKKMSIKLSKEEFALILSKMDPDETQILNVEDLLGNSKIRNRNIEKIKDSLKEIEDFLESSHTNLSKEFQKKDKENDHFLTKKRFLKVLKANNVIIDEAEEKAIIKVYNSEDKDQVHFLPFVQDLEMYSGGKSPLKKKVGKKEAREILRYIYDRMLDVYENEKNFLEENKFTLESEISREKLTAIFKQLKNGISEN